MSEPKPSETKPPSVKIIAVVTLIATLLVTLVLGRAEVSLLSQFPTIYAYAYVLVALILQGYAFIVSIAMLVSDSKYVWYGSVAFWILIIIGDLSFILPIISLAPIGFAILLVWWLGWPMWSSIICLHFFLRRKEKDYFHV